MPKRAYIQKDITGERLVRIQIANQIIAKYLAMGLRLTLRQLYYQFVAHHGLPNNERSYQNLGKLISEGRLAGYVDWNAIEDRGRVADVPASWTSAQALVEVALRQFRLPRWQGQPHYVELWVEKQALAGVLEPVSDRHHITLMVNKGYSSQSAMYASAQRFLSYGAKCESSVLLYLGDHDPSGEDMVRDVRDRLHTFGVRNLRVHKVALTMAQVRHHNPPPNPAKITDSRAAKYIEEHGDESWEVDALDPNTLVQLIETEIKKYLDVPLMEDVKRREQEQIEAVRRGMNGGAPMPSAPASATSAPSTSTPRTSGNTKSRFNDWLLRVNEFSDCYEMDKEKMTLAEFCDLLNAQTPEE
jgi:hypothetical protein